MRVTSPQSSPATLLEVSAAEFGWLDELRQFWVESAVDPQDITAVSEFFDAYRQGWFAVRSTERQDPNPVINAIGVALGDHLVSAGMRWVVADYGDGMELAVHADPSDVLVCPINTVAKRWTVDTGLGFLADFVAYVQGTISATPA